MRACRLKPALVSLLVGWMVAGVSAAQPDAGRRPDAGGPLSARGRDGGATSPLNAADQEVVDNLELLEHLPEADLLPLLLPVRDQ